MLTFDKISTLHGEINNSSGNMNYALENYKANAMKWLADAIVSKFNGYLSQTNYTFFKANRGVDSTSNVLFFSIWIPTDNYINPDSQYYDASKAASPNNHSLYRTNIILVYTGTSNIGTSDGTSYGNGGFLIAVGNTTATRKDASTDLINSSIRASAIGASTSDANSMTHGSTTIDVSTLLADTKYKFIRPQFKTGTVTSATWTTYGITSYLDDSLIALTQKDSNYSASSVSTDNGLLITKINGKLLITTGASCVPTSQNLSEAIVINTYTSINNAERRYIGSVRLDVKNDVQDATYGVVKKFKYESCAAKTSSSTYSYRYFDERSADLNTDNMFTVMLPYETRGNCNCPLILQDGTVLFLVGTHFAVPFQYPTQSS